jgi:hypothetical protein
VKVIWSPTLGVASLTVLVTDRSMLMPCASPKSVGRVAVAVCGAGAAVLSPVDELDDLPSSHVSVLRSGRYPTVARLGCAAPKWGGRA